MEYNTLISGALRYGATEKELCAQTLGVPPDEICPRVILAPWWEPDLFPTLGRAIPRTSPSAEIKIWRLETDCGEMTYIKTGIGAPVLMDTVLALGLTACERAVMIGSVGALDQAFQIGDLVVPQVSLCGDGASRYLSDSPLRENDSFAAQAVPDPGENGHLEQIVEQISQKYGVSWHKGRIFSIDTIFAQFAHLEELLELGCNGVEMETAAAFRAAQLAGIPMTALLSVSDNTLNRKSLICGRTESDELHRRRVRREIVPEILLEYMRRG